MTNRLIKKIAHNDEVSNLPPSTDARPAHETVSPCTFMSFRCEARNLVFNKFRALRFLTYVRNDSFRYCNTAPDAGSVFQQSHISGLFTGGAFPQGRRNNEQQNSLPVKAEGLLQNAQVQGAQKTELRGVYGYTLSGGGCSATRQMSVFQQPRGFTLVEILIAIFILSLVMATVYVSYSGILKTSHQLEEEGAIYQMTRISMDRMIKDLSSLQTSANSFDLRAEKNKLSNREFHTISFWSASHLAFGENEGPERPAAISYYVRQDEDRESFSLWRADVSGSKPDKGKNADGGFIICKNVNSFQLTFYDSEGRESDSWDSSFAAGGDQTGKAPAAVKVELSLVNANDQEKPYKFMTKVFLPVKKQTP